MSCPALIRVSWLCSGDGMHAVTYELAWRYLHDPTRRASQEIRKQLGHNLKSSLQYVFRLATLDDPYYPTEGYALRCGPCEQPALFLRVM